MAKRRAKALGLCLALGCALPTAACTRSASELAPSPSLGPAPKFETKTLAGEDVSLADYRGQVVLLNVWATWCDPCVRELPELARMHEQLQPKGFTVIGLNTDVRRKLPSVRTMVARSELPFPIWVDFESQSQVAFQLRGYPTSFLIDREGEIRWKREGEIVPNDPELGLELDKLLNVPR